MASGAFLSDNTDLAMSGGSGSLALKRAYNSLVDAGLSVRNLAIKAAEQHPGPEGVDGFGLDRQMGYGSIDQKRR